MSPISDDDYVADLAFEFGYPLLVVASNTLGVINQTLQALITATTFRDGIHVAGIILNDALRPELDVDPSVESNLAQLERHCVPPVLSHLTWNAERFNPDVDWWEIARGK